MPRRIALVLLTATAMGVLSAASPTSAHADTACYKVETSGSVPGNRTIGPICRPTPFVQHCRFEGVSLGTLIGVRVEFCLPIV